MKARSIFVLIIMLLLAAATIAQQPKPAPAPAAFRAFLGEYASDSDTVIVLEKDQKLYAQSKRADAGPMRELSETSSTVIDTERSRTSRAMVSSTRANPLVRKRAPLNSK